MIVRKTNSERKTCATISRFVLKSSERTTYRHSQPCCAHFCSTSQNILEARLLLNAVFVKRCTQRASHLTCKFLVACLTRRSFRSTSQLPVTATGQVSLYSPLITLALPSEYNRWSSGANLSMHSDTSILERMLD